MAPQPGERRDRGSRRSRTDGRHDQSRHRELCRCVLAIIPSEVTSKLARSRLYRSLYGFDTIDLRNSNTVLCLRLKIMTAVDISHEGIIARSVLRACAPSYNHDVLVS